MNINKALVLVIAAFTGFFLCPTGQAQRTATATPTVVNGFVVAITLTDGGAGYTNAPAVTITGGGGTGATATATVLNGAVDKVIVGSAGNGYTATPTVVIADPPRLPFSDGLVAYYPLAGDLRDLVRPTSDPAVLLSGSFTSGRFGLSNTALLLDGNPNGGLKINNEAIPALNSPRTFSVWLRPIGTSTTMSRYLIGTPVTSVVAGGLTVRLNGLAPGFPEANVGIDCGWTATATLQTPIAEGVWSHLVITLQGNRTRVLVNGVNMPLTGDGILPDGVSFNTIPGQEYYVGTFAGQGAFIGAVSDFRIYNRALSEQQIKDLYVYEARVQPFSDGLVAYYPFNGNANDESGNADNGTILGALPAPDRFGRTNSAFYFNASNPSGISTRGAFIPAGTSARSISLWFQSDWANPTNGTVERIGPLVAFGSPTTEQQQFSLLLTKYQWFLVDLSGASRNWLRTQTPFTDRKWHHLVLAFENNHATAYFDGQLLEWTGFPLPGTVVDTARSDFWIGARGSQYFDGSLDDIRIYNRALAAQEVKDLYAYEASEAPWVTMEVKTVQVTMHVKPARKYQLQVSTDLKTWVNSGDAFVATFSEIQQEFNAIDVGRFFRVIDAP